jgi:hypothetical protein
VSEIRSYLIYTYIKASPPAEVERTPALEPELPAAHVDLVK